MQQKYDWLKFQQGNDLIKYTQAGSYDDGNKTEIVGDNVRPFLTTDLRSKTELGVCCSNQGTSSQPFLLQWI